MRRWSVQLGSLVIQKELQYRPKHRSPIQVESWLLTTAFWIEIWSATSVPWETCSHTKQTKKNVILHFTLSYIHSVWLYSWSEVLNVIQRLNRTSSVQVHDQLGEFHWHNTQCIISNPEDDIFLGGCFLTTPRGAHWIPRAFINQLLREWNSSCNNKVNQPVFCLC